MIVWPMMDMSTEQPSKQPKRTPASRAELEAWAKDYNWRMPLLFGRYPPVETIQQIEAWEEKMQERRIAPALDLSTASADRADTPMAPASYIKLADGKIDRTIDLGKTPNGGIVIGDIDENGRLLGIEVIGWRL